MERGHRAQAQAATSMHVALSTIATEDSAAQGTYSLRAMRHSGTVSRAPARSRTTHMHAVRTAHTARTHTHTCCTPAQQ